MNSGGNMNNKRVITNKKDLNLHRVKDAINSVLKKCENPERIEFAESMERKINQLSTEDLSRHINI